MATATKKKEDLKELNAEDLAQKLHALKLELFDLRMQRAEGKLARPHRIKQVRRDVARVLTFLKEKKK
jgi:large subunit ribosomal protein L29